MTNRLFLAWPLLAGATMRHEAALPLVLGERRTNVRLVWVVPDGEAPTPERYETLRHEVSSALRYWNQHATCSPNLRLVREETVRTTLPVRYPIIVAQSQPGYLTIVLVVNDRSGQDVDLDDPAGWHAGWNWPHAPVDARVVYTTSRAHLLAPCHSGLRCGASPDAILAHELGHAFGLEDDLLRRGGIMDYPRPAWESWQMLPDEAAAPCRWEGR
jgi:hypothetical protein